jgi:dTDP-4-dehydrorhamnose reductase
VQKVLISGGSGILGKYLVSTVPPLYNVESTYYTNSIPGLQVYNLDITNKSQVSYTFDRIKPDVVIHCAAVGNVDYAERHFVETHAVNVLGTRNIVQAANDHNALLVHISTNAVFVGDKAPYSETSECHPVNAYGKIKLEGEQMVMGLADKWLVIRPFLLYGYPWPGGRPNWLVTILQNLSAGKVTRLVNDTYWQPTYAGDCAEAIWRLIQSGKVNEIYHVASDEAITLFEFGLKIAKYYNQNGELIQPMASSELPAGLAKRPVDTTYDLGKLHGLGIECKSVEEGLKALK